MIAPQTINTPTNTPAVGTAQQWYVVYTKARHELKVTEKLLTLGIEAYCPLKIQTKVWSDRVKRVVSPLFSSYVFVKLEVQNLRRVFEVAGVVRYVYWCGKPAVVRDAEIVTLKRWLNDFDHLELDINYFEENQKVKIRSGNFMDCEATVIRQKGGRLELVLAGIGLSLSAKTNQIVLTKVP
jgi:transcriptional antiterminator RfaH